MNKNCKFKAKKSVVLKFKTTQGAQVIVNGGLVYYMKKLSKGTLSGCAYINIGFVARLIEVLVGHHLLNRNH